MVSPIPPKPPAPPKPPGKRPPGGNIVRDTRGPNYPKNPARPGETKAQYSERVRGENGGSSSGGSRPDRSPVKPPPPKPIGGKPTTIRPGRGNMGPGSGGAPGGSRGTDGGKPARVMGGPADKMGPVRGTAKGPAPMPRMKKGGMVKGKK